MISEEKCGYCIFRKYCDAKKDDECNVKEWTKNLSKKESVHNRIKRLNEED